MEKLTTCGKLVKTTGSAEDTKRFGRSLASLLKGDSRNLFLTGGLGAGKTTLLKGVGCGLGLNEDEILSPTFQLVRKYRAQTAELIHLDLYRLTDIYSVLHLGWSDMIESGAVMAVEWADRAREIWPEQGIFLFAEMLSEDRRRFTLYSGKKNVPRS